MDFAPHEHEQMIAEAVRAFADGVVRHAAAGWDARGQVPEAALKELGRLGVLGLTAPEDLGGLGLDATAEVVALEVLAEADAGLAQLVVQHHTLALGHLLRAGSEHEVRRLAPRLATGQLLAAWAHGEDMANLDADLVQTRAVRDGDGWRLDGCKPLVLLGQRADVAVVTAMADSGPDGGGLTAFLIELDAPGVTRNPLDTLLGLRSLGAADLTLQGVPGVKLGEVGQAAADVAAVRDAARLGTAAVALGVTRSALRQASRYSQERQQFGKAIATFQPIQWQIANSAVDLDTARLLVGRAAWLRAQGKPAGAAIRMAKAAACEAALRVADRAIQIHGGYGYTKDFSVERAYRDAASLQVLHGTGALQRIELARVLGARQG
jgi:alkylation response protein AidB-like acyl-CoA dehydrogenase